MNFNLKKMILENEYLLLNTFNEYRQSINQFIKKIESIKYDAMLYELIVRSFSSKDKIEQENYYNMRGFKSSRQIINENKALIDFNDRPLLNDMVEEEEYTALEICSMADNYNNQVGMYFLSGINSVIIKSTVEDNDRPYDDRWLEKDILLRYYMQNEKEDNVKTLNFSHKPNSVIFNALMNQELLNIYVFINQKKGLPYKYKGIYHPCGITSKNKAFLLFKDGREDKIPFDNLEAQFMLSLVYSKPYPDRISKYKLSKGLEKEFFDYSNIRIRRSKRNAIQQNKIDLEISLRADEMVLELEREKLINLGHPELASNVKNISFDNNENGYDIRSFDIDHFENIKEIYIKVKPSVSHNSTKFSLTKQEYLFQEENENSRLFRVYDIYTDCPKYIDLTDRLANLRKEPSEYVFSIG